MQMQSCFRAKTKKQQRPYNGKIVSAISDLITTRIGIMGELKLHDTVQSSAISYRRRYIG